MWEHKRGLAAPSGHALTYWELVYLFYCNAIVIGKGGAGPDSKAADWKSSSPVFGVLTSVSEQLLV